MLSRLADNLYWFGRYLRRAENGARLLNVNASLTLDIAEGGDPGWGPLVEISGAMSTFRKYYQEADEASVVRFLTVDERNPGSIRASVEHAREILRVSRDALPRDAWEWLNDLHYYLLEQGEAALVRAGRQAFLSRISSTALLVGGLLEANMSRDVGYHFLHLGTLIEQADMTTRILDVRAARAVPDSAEARALSSATWISVLRSLSAYQMYRRHVKRRVSGGGVLRFLLQDRAFPRSVAYCLATGAEILPYLPVNRRVERALERTRALARDADVAILLASEVGIPRLLDEIQLALGMLHEAIAETYFQH